MARGEASGLGLRVELVRGPEGPRARLLAGPATLAPGLRLLSLVAEPAGEVLGAELRQLRGRAVELRLEVGAEVLGAAARALVGVELTGWPIDHVSLELAADASGAPILVLALSGPDIAGWPGLLQFELTLAVQGGRVALTPRRAWLVAPLSAAPLDLWRRLAAALVLRWPELVAHAGRAATSLAAARAPPASGVTLDLFPVLRRLLVAGGDRCPELHNLTLRPPRDARPLLRLHWDASAGRDDSLPRGPFVDPWRHLRAALIRSDREAALAALDEAGPPPGAAGARRLARALAHVQANLWRHHDPRREAAALRTWLAAGPDDPEAWWRLTVLHAREGDSAGVDLGLSALARRATSPAASLRVLAARAIVQARMGGAGIRVVHALEDMLRETCTNDPAALAAGWRGLAFARAVDPSSPLPTAREACERAAAEPRPWFEPTAFTDLIADLARGAGRPLEVDTPLPRPSRARPASPRPRRQVGPPPESTAIASAGEIRPRTASPSADPTVEQARTEVSVLERHEAAVLPNSEGSAESGRLPVSEVPARESPPNSAEAERSVSLDDPAAAWSALVASAMSALSTRDLVALDRQVTAHPALAPRDLPPWTGTFAPAELLVRSRVLAAAGDPRAAAFLHLVGLSVPGWSIPSAPLVGPAPERSDFAALAEAFAELTGASAGIHAERRTTHPSPAALAARERAELILADWRPRLGLALPVVAGKGPAVAVFNEHEPTLVVSAALARLPAEEQRFRLAHAASMIRAGLASALDPRGASLPELLGALTALLRGVESDSPGAGAVARIWRRRGWRPERWSHEQRARLLAELERWRDATPELARHLQRDSLAAALALSGELRGALWALGRDARVGDDPARILALPDVGWLLSWLGLCHK